MSSEKILSLAATVIALCALFFSIYEASLSRQHTRLLAEPNMDSSFYYSHNEKVSWSTFNMGLGPAKIMSSRILVDNIPQESWQTALRQLYGKKEIPDASIWYSNLAVGSYVKPDAKNSIIFKTENADLASFIKDNYHRVEIEVCYCSIFQECWISGRSAQHKPMNDGCPTSELNFGERFIEPNNGDKYEAVDNTQ